nr:hypothetical protein [Tanacetum cinerariifolium]
MSCLGGKERSNVRGCGGGPLIYMDWSSWSSKWFGENDRCDVGGGSMSIWSGIKFRRGGCKVIPSIESKVSGGRGCEVFGGRSSKLSIKGCGDVVGVWNISSNGSKMVMIVGALLSV